MAITKSASELFMLQRVLEKKAFDVPDVQESAVYMDPTGTTRGMKHKGVFSKVWGAAGKFAFPALTTVAIGQGIASGQQSVGEAVGENVAGLAAGTGAYNLFNKYVPKGGRLGFIGKGLHFLGGLAAGIVGGIAGGMPGGMIGDKIAPWRRKVPSVDVRAYDNPVATEYKQWQANQVG